MGGPLARGIRKGFEEEVTLCQGLKDLSQPSGNLEEACPRQRAQQVPGPELGMSWMVLRKRKETRRDWG